MIPATVIIPNYNGREFLKDCLDSLIKCEKTAFPITVVDDCSTDGSADLIRSEYPEVELTVNDSNLGFAASVNRGIARARTPYVILLNNDTVVKPGFVSALCRGIMKNKRYFSAQAKILSMKDPDIMDSAGDFYTVLGWARARGNGKNAGLYSKPCRIFSACGAAVIYRRDVLLSMGLFDESHFAYLEDVDVGYRAKLMGYENIYWPRASVLHFGSGFSGSRHNPFKVKLSSGNSIYLAYKNMPPLMLALNLPFLAAGHVIKLVYFAKKGLLIPYLQGIKRGIGLIRNCRRRPVRAGFRRLAGIELELFRNIRYI